jgi:hypothetical protein
VKFTILILTLTLISCSSTKKYDVPKHVGLWDLVADYCDETYELKSDGTQTVISGPEVSVDQYSFTPFGNTGFYAWEYQVIEYNSKPSCNGTFDTHIGERTLVFAKFKNNFTEMHLYNWANEDSFMGAYLKKR